MRVNTYSAFDAQMEEWERSEQRPEQPEVELLDDPFEGATPLPIDNPFEMPEPTATPMTGVADSLRDIELIVGEHGGQGEEAGKCGA
jgi:hypothetical protein